MRALPVLVPWRWLLALVALALLVHGAGGAQAAPPSPASAPAQTPASASAPAQTPAPASAPAGYDHAAHAQALAAAKRPALACGACHTVDSRGLVRGRPGHKACFGACHGTPPKPLSAAPGRPYAVIAEHAPLCLACHDQASMRRLGSGVASRLPADLMASRPADAAPDHRLLMSHAAHAEPSAATRRGCLACHEEPEASASARPGSRPAGARGAPARSRTAALPHARCTGCHLAPATAYADIPTEIPLMTACEACHQPLAGNRSEAAQAPDPAQAQAQTRAPAAEPLMPSLVPYGQPIAFSHASHRARGAAPCESCHQAITTTADASLPAPAKQDCQACHDGEASFSVTAPSCRQCHTGAPDVERSWADALPGSAGSELQPVAVQEPRFSHTQHLAHAPQVATACADCHSLDAAGRPVASSRGHQPCATAGCHASDFAAPMPRTCASCHTGTEPWRPLHLDAPPPPESELGVRFSHKTHLLDNGLDIPCTDCHRLATNGRDMRLPRDHSACIACHGPGSATAPALEACDTCHQLGLVAQRLAQRLTAPWTVRARFRHQPHRTDPRAARGSPEPSLACNACHTGITTAATVDTIPTPGKATCIGCHDGSVAFKLTGHGCNRCHGGPDKQP